MYLPTLGARPVEAARAWPSRLVDLLLYAQRLHESGNRYTRKVTGYNKDRSRGPIRTASGAYQYTISTWNRYRGYPEAYLAPAHVQDERARRDLLARLARYKDVEKAVAAHFYPAWANDKSRWGRKPNPHSPTVRAYVNAVLRPVRVQLASLAPSPAPRPRNVPWSYLGPYGGPVAVAGLFVLGRYLLWL